MNQNKMLQPISKEDFLKTYQSFDAQYCEWLKAKSYCEQMMDIYGELCRAMEYHTEWQATNDIEVFDALCDEIELLSELFCVVYAQNMLPGYRETTRIIEWGIYDYLLWNNTAHQSKEAVLGWFSQWVNYSNEESKKAGW